MSRTEGRGGGAAIVENEEVCLVEMARMVLITIELECWIFIVVLVGFENKVMIKYYNLL